MFAMNMAEQIPLRDPVFNYFGYVTRSGIARCVLLVENHKKSIAGTTKINV